MKTMNKIWCALLVSSGVGFASSSAMANTPPVLAKTCYPGQIATDPAGPDPHYSEDCSVGYVLPPSKGTATVTAYSDINMNMGFCPSLDTAQTQVNTLSVRITDLQNQEADLLAQIGASQLNDLALLLGEAKANADAAAAILAQENITKAQLFADYQLAASDAGLCMLQPLADCTALIAARDAARTAYVDHYTNVWRPAFLADIQAKQALAIAQSNWDVENNRVQAIRDRYNALELAIIGLQSQAMDIYKTFGGLSGASAQIDYDTHWGELVAAYQAKYSGLGAGMNWVPMPMDRAALNATLNKTVASNSVVSDIPFFLTARVPGYLDFGIGNLPTGADPLAPPSTTFDPSKVFPSSFPLGVNISLIGACPNRNAVDKGAALQASMTPVLTGEFELMTHVAYQASFNLAKFYQRIEKVGKRNKWFSSKTFHDLVIHDSVDEQWTWNYQGDVDLGDALREDVRARLYAHVMDNIGTRVVDTSAPGVSTPGSNTGTIGNQLRATCVKGGGYLCIAGWIVGGLDSLFGSGSASSYFLATNDTMASENVSTTYFVRKATQTQF